jgi:hypothetical protein
LFYTPPSPQNNTQFHRRKQRGVVCKKFPFFEKRYLPLIEKHIKLLGERERDTDTDRQRHRVKYNPSSRWDEYGSMEMPNVSLLQPCSVPVAQCNTSEEAGE